MVIDQGSWIISARPPDVGNSRQEFDFLSVEEKSSRSESRVKASCGVNRGAPTCEVGSVDYAGRNETIGGKMTLG